MKPILFLDIDGCVRPTGNFLAQLDGEAETMPGMTMLELTFQRAGGLKHIIKFTDEEGKRKNIPMGSEWTQQFPIMNHMLDFLRRAHDLFDCHWCSWWPPDSIRPLMKALEIDEANWTIQEPEKFIFRENHKPGDEGKFSLYHEAYNDAKWNVVRKQHEGRPFVWVDDCEIHTRAQEWAAQLGLPAMCVLSDHETGVSPDQIFEMEKFAVDLTAA
jgi:hypothetical protein